MCIRMAVVGVTLGPALTSTDAFCQPRTMRAAAWVRRIAQVSVAPVRGAPPPGPQPPAYAATAPGPPPPPPVEHVEPRRGFVWIEGNYDWRDGRYVWAPGHFERARKGRRWHGGAWEWRGNHYAWAPGFWAEEVAASPPPPPEYVVQSPVAPPPPMPPQGPGQGVAGQGREWSPTPPPEPRHGFVWVPGAQEWRDGRYVWVEGRWERERSGDAWRAGHWDRDGDDEHRDRHVWHPGGWEHGRHDAYARGPGGHAEVVISGRVAAPDGRPLPGITLVLAGTSEGRTVTDGNGAYVFTGLSPGSYAVRPSPDGRRRCSFGPDVVNLDNLGGSVTQNFTASCEGGWR